MLQVNVGRRCNTAVTYKTLTFLTGSICTLLCESHILVQMIVIFATFPHISLKLLLHAACLYLL